MNISVELSVTAAPMGGFLLSFLPDPKGLMEVSGEHRAELPCFFPTHRGGISLGYPQTPCFEFCLSAVLGSWGMGELLSQSSCLCELRDVSASMGGVWQGSCC